MSDALSPIKKAIEERLAARGGESFAVFDFDNTCIINDVGEATFAYLCGHELLRDRTLLGEKDESDGYHERVFRTYHTLLTEKKMRAAYILCGRMFSGFSPGEAEAAALAAITEEGSRIGSKMLYDVHIERGLSPRPVVLALMVFLREKGVAIWIVSASAEPSVRAAMQHFGIKGELVGVRSVLKNKVFTSELEEPMSIMEGKAECIKKYIDNAKEPLLVAGDSMNDLPMLEMAEIQVVVDRGNELAKIAREREWFLL